MALLLIGGLANHEAFALSLGRMVVRSSLGEPLRAEIEVADLTPAEAESLTVQTASPAGFRAAGIEYNPALSGLQIALDRSSGRAVMRVSGNRPVNDPFLEVLVEANWSGGRLSRNYTLLLDPPAANRSPAQIAPQITASPPPAPRAEAPAVVIAPPAAPQFAPPVAAAPARPLSTQRPPAPIPAPAPRPAAPPPATTGQMAVRPGDTAGRIAGTTKAPSVSLDQMLVALLQANPDAFIGGNVNRMRSGAVLTIPDVNQAAATPAPQARQIIVAQSRDFNEFRRRLAGRAPSVETSAPQRTARGTVQTQVEDRKPSATTPDRLTLSKGAVRGAGDAEQQIAQASQARDNAARVAELSRNVSELNRLGAAPAVAPIPAPTPAPTAAPVPATPPVVAPPATEAPAPVAAAPSAADTAASAPAAAPAAVPAKTPVPAVPAATVPVEEDGILAGPLGDPRILGIVGLLAAMLVALISYRTVQRRRVAHNNSSFLESRLPPDSFFGASGGQHVDTREGAPSTLATTYSPSQLDAGGDVDPLAEADVYLAYGRDLQAEEILKEALRAHPTRTALHAKLAEIYAKRQDVSAFNALTADAHRLTNGTGDDWQRISTLGREIDPSNPLYHLPGSPAAVAAGTFGAAAAAAIAADAALTPAPAALAPLPVDAAPDRDLDLDLGEPAPVLDMLTPPPAPTFAPIPEPAPAPVPPSLDLDFSAFTAPSPEPVAAPPAPVAAEEDFGLDFTLDEPVARTPSAPEVSPEPVTDFDFGDLSLDIDEPAALAADADAASQDAEPAEISGEDALATKLALADEFNAIGDVDGARHLIEEVIAEASGDVRSRAERMLAALQ